jgi:hypothetical protein
MAQFTHNISTVETVGDLRKRVAELERECKRLRGYPDRDAAICRAEAGNVDQSSPLAQTKPLANLGHCERSPDTDQWLS